MANWNPKANSIFLEARRLTDEPQRAAYLDLACEDDAALRADVVALLQGYNRTDRLFPAMDGPRPGALASEIAEQPGAEVGPYQLLEEIGEGGVGVVFKAEQQQPIRRVVALKIIKPGMDSRQVVARFAIERQALALMEHPNIAKILDAGATAGGRPYFVMELVQGLPITAFCHEGGLSLRERLELFIQVCYAVQHAHQKGVIHRDLKPTNVLVDASHGEPLPKVIDFGVAKAVGQKLTERTMFTEVGTMIGTFEYMSPEQAGLNHADVDTRSDVYSLGAMLYEMLSGAPPLDAQRLRSAPLDDMLRMIREEEPPKPSDRLGQLAGESASAAGPPLDRRAFGDLDWIVMKAIDKDRGRRYATSDALARDLERYLAREAVEARPPSAAYRLRLLVLRHRGPVIAAALLIIVLLAGIAASTSQAIRATRAEQAALASAAKERKAAASERRARDAEAEARAKAEDRLKFLFFAFDLDRTEADGRKLSDAIEHLTQEFRSTSAGVTDSPDVRAEALLRLGQLLAGRGYYGEAARNLRECINLTNRLDVVWNAKIALANCLLWLGHVDEGSELYRRLLGQKLDWATGSGVETLRAAWPGLDQATAGPTDQPGQDGLEFDGVDDYVVLPRLQFDGQPPWTLEAIVNAAEVDQFRSHDVDLWTSLISTTEGGGIGLETTNGKWSIGLYTATLRNSVWTKNYDSALALDKPQLHRWVHLAGVWDGEQLRLYVDGQLQETRTGVTRCSALSEGPFMLAADPVSLGNDGLAEGLFHGRLRAVRISHRVEYAESFSPPDRLEDTPQTLARYDFTIDAGRYAIDRSGHGHHGIIVGARFVKADE